MAGSHVQETHAGEENVDAGRQGNVAIDDAADFEKKPSDRRASVTPRTRWPCRRRVGRASPARSVSDCEARWHGCAHSAGSAHFSGLAARAGQRRHPREAEERANRSTSGKLSDRLPCHCPAQRITERGRPVRHIRLGAPKFTVSATQPADRPTSRMDAGYCARNSPSTWESR